MKTLFVVDTDNAFQEQVQELIDPEEVDVIAADKGADAIQTASRKAPEAIFLSLELKDVNGFLVCSSLKKNPRTKDIPVLIISSTRTEEDFEQHRKLKFRADGYHRKPIETETLSTILVDLLGAAALREGNTNPLASEFTEENIDRLLDSTFMGGEGEPSVSGEGAVSDEPALDTEPAARSADKADDEEFSFSVDDLEEDSRPAKPAPGEKATTTAPESNGIQTVADAADVVEPLKQALREKEAQAIQLEKENEFLTSENRNLLMNITSLKADIEERVATEQEKNAELVRQVSELEERIALLQKTSKELEEQVADTTAKRDAALAEQESLKNAQAGIEAERETAISEKDSLKSRLTEQASEFEEKESMLMSTIENLTKNTRELEDQLKSYKGRISKLKGILGELDNSTDGSGA